MSDSVEMPLYRCHKQVRALKIRAVVDPNIGLPNEEGDVVLTFSDPGFEAAAYTADAEYVRKHNPKPGGYYVVYEDGYKSFSPADAFEGGYTRI